MTYYSETAPPPQTKGRETPSRARRLEIRSKAVMVVVIKAVPVTMADTLADGLIMVSEKYREAGADYITIREMGAPTDVLSPRSFKQVIKPHLEKIFSRIESPKILHICGDTNLIIGLMNECGADAISVETKNDLAKSREVIGPGPLLFGKVDGYNVLSNGTPEDVEKAVLESIEGGVDAVWPACDIWPTAPVENLRAMVETVKKYGAGK